MNKSVPRMYYVYSIYIYIHIYAHNTYIYTQYERYVYETASGSGTIAGPRLSACRDSSTLSWEKLRSASGGTVRAVRDSTAKSERPESPIGLLYGFRGLVS